MSAERSRANYRVGQIIIMGYKRMEIMQFKVCNNFLCNDLLISQLWNYLIPTTFN